MSDRYAFSLTTFSPSGKLGQIEHALAAVNQGVTSVGIKAKNGIVIATEKKFPSPLVDASSLEKVSAISQTIGVVYSGMGPDARILLDKVKDIAGVMQDATQSGGVRPFGVSLLVAGYDSKNGPSLYQVDPSGAYFAWKATAIGKNMVSAKTFLEKRYNEDMEIEDAIHTAILTLKEGLEGTLGEDSIEVGIAFFEEKEEHGAHVDELDGKRVKKVGKFKVLGKAEIKDFLVNIQ